jgi:hypothetical protein
MVMAKAAQSYPIKRDLYNQVASCLLAQYAPYSRMHAFEVGAQAYARHDYHCPYSADSVEGQAWDRGLEYAMRLSRVR